LVPNSDKSGNYAGHLYRSSFDQPISPPGYADPQADYYAFIGVALGALGALGTDFLSHLVIFITDMFKLLQVFVRKIRIFRRIRKIHSTLYDPTAPIRKRIAVVRVSIWHLSSLTPEKRWCGCKWWLTV
jgi:hypothetical protein